MDWDKWHNRYETNERLQERVSLVADQIATAISDCSSDPVPILSICAGDGRDLLLALSSAKLATRRIRAYLVESNVDVVVRGRSEIAELGLSDSIEFRCADATRRDTYADLIPADVVIVSGVFGNLKDPDVARLVRSLRSFCAVGAYAVWTRNLKEFDDGISATQRIQRHFSECEFEQVRYELTASAVFAVGTHKYCGKRDPLPNSDVLFEFSGFWAVSESS